MFGCKGICKLVDFREHSKLKLKVSFVMLLK
jgi:hypothetical protein